MKSGSRGYETNDEVIGSGQQDSQHKDVEASGESDFEDDNPNGSAPDFDGNPFAEDDLFPNEQGEDNEDIFPGGIEGDASNHSSGHGDSTRNGNHQKSPSSSSSSSEATADEKPSSTTGIAIWLGLFIDSIPESLVIGT